MAHVKSILVGGVGLALALSCPPSASAGSGTPLEQPMTFESVGDGGNCSTCEWISATGRIDAETPKTFARYIAAERKERGGHIPDIYFHSTSGSISAAVNLGRIIREEHLNTSVGQTIPDEYGHHQLVPGICSAACVFSLMGGFERTVDRPQKVGIQQLHASALADPSAFQNSADDTIVQQALDIVQYVKDMGVDTAILVRARSSTGISWLGHDEIAGLNLDNMKERQAEWKIEPYKDGIIAQTAAVTGPRDPENFSIYCEKGAKGLVKLVYSSRVLPDVEPVDIITSALEYSINAGNMVIEEGAINNRVRIRRGQDKVLYVSYNVGQEVLAKVMKAGQAGAFINLPDALNRLVGRNFSMKGAAPYVSAAMDNCVAS